jgi:hypothetical protein
MCSDIGYISLNIGNPIGQGYVRLDADDRHIKSLRVQGQGRCAADPASAAGDECSSPSFQSIQLCNQMTFYHSSIDIFVYLLPVTDHSSSRFLRKNHIIRDLLGALVGFSTNPVMIWPSAYRQGLT